MTNNIIRLYLIKNLNWLEKKKIWPKNIWSDPIFYFVKKSDSTQNFSLDQRSDSEFFFWLNQKSDLTQRNRSVKNSFLLFYWTTFDWNSMENTPSCLKTSWIYPIPPKTSNLQIWFLIFIFYQITLGISCTGITMSLVLYLNK